MENNDYIIGKHLLFFLINSLILIMMISYINAWCNALCVIFLITGIGYILGGYLLYVISIIIPLFITLSFISLSIYLYIIKRRFIIPILISIFPLIVSVLFLGPTIFLNWLENRPY